MTTAQLSEAERPMSHTILRIAEGYRCSVCKQTWRSNPSSDCPGATVYQWKPWPAGMLTAKQMKEKRLIPGPLAGVIRYDKAADGSGWLKVYRESEAMPKPALTEKQIAASVKRKAAIEKSWYCANCGERLIDMREHRAGVCYDCQAKWQRERDRLRAGRDAYETLLKSDLRIWDSETTDLDGNFIEIAVIDLTGRVLFDRRLRPQCLIASGAYAVHGIRDEELASEPTFFDVFHELRDVLHGKPWLIYSAEFDSGHLYSEMHNSSYAAYYKAYPIKSPDIICAKEMYAEWYGEWHNYYKSYRWQKLTSACADLGIHVRESAHSAVGDCLRTLEVIYALADWYKAERDHHE